MATHSITEIPDTESDVADLAPSAKLVAKVLEHEGDCTQTELAEATFLPARTLRFGITQLEENGFITSRLSLRDARKHVYSLNLSPKAGN